MKIRNNENGFTLVELLIAIVIAVLVGVSIFSFMVVGTRSFTATSSDINIQHESQLVFNQMQDLIVDTTIGMDYMYSDGSVTDSIVQSDSEIPATATQKKLIMYNYDPDDATKHVYEMIWDADKEEVYYNEYSPSVTEETLPDGTVGDHVSKGAAIHTMQLMGENVADFSVDLSQMISKRIVRVDLEFEKGMRHYRSSHNITLRNQIDRGGKIPEYVELTNPTDPEKVTGVAILYAEPGDVIDMKAAGGYKVEAVGGGEYPDQDIRFFMSNKESYDSETSVSTEGMLSVSSGQKNDFYVVVASRSGKGAPLTVMVKMIIVDAVEVKLIGEKAQEPEQLSEEISKPLNSVTVNAGESLELEAVVTGREFDKRPTVDMHAVTWSCDEQYADKVTFSQESKTSTGGTCKVTLDTSLKLAEGERLTIYATSKRSVDKGYRDIVYGVFYIYQPAGDFTISTMGGLIRGTRDHTNLYAELDEEKLRELGIKDTSKYVLYVDVKINELVYEVDINNHPSRKYKRINNVTNTGSIIKAEGVYMTIEAPHIEGNLGNPNAEYEYVVTYYIAKMKEGDGSNWGTVQLVGEDGVTDKGYSIYDYLYRSNTVTMTCERAFLHYHYFKNSLDKDGNEDKTQWDGPLTTAVSPRLYNKTVDIRFYGSDSIADSPEHARITNIMNNAQFRLFDNSNGWTAYDEGNRIIDEKLTKFLKVEGRNAVLAITGNENAKANNYNDNNEVKWSDDFPSHVRIVPFTHNQLHTNEWAWVGWFDNYVDVYLWNIEVPKLSTGMEYSKLYFPVKADGDVFDAYTTGENVWKTWTKPWKGRDNDYLSYCMYEKKNGDGSSKYCLSLRFNGDTDKEFKYECNENDRMWTRIN